jgi:hypothetical protein
MPTSTEIAVMPKTVVKLDLKKQSVPAPVATVTATNSFQTVDPIDELILKLIGGDEATRSAVTKNRETLQAIANYRDTEHGGVLKAIMAYDQKFRSLPDWGGLSDYIDQMMYNEGVLVELADVKEFHESGWCDFFTSLDVLIDHVAESVESMKLSARLQRASQIAVSGWQQVKPGSYELIRLWKGPADAQEWLSTQLDLGAEDNYQPEEGEVDLIAGREGASTFTITAIPASAVKPQAITWLWPERLPLGKMSLISGKPDNGKSTVALDIVARVTRGADYPDGQKNTLGPRDVLMAVAEDDLSDTVVPRLMAAGADLNRIQFINRVRVQEFDEKEGKKSEVRSLQLAEDVEKLRRAVMANPQIALVVVDTITSYFGDVNTNADQDIRPVMDALAKAFGNCGACFLGIIHHNKKSDVDAVQKILGASSVAGAVRAVYGCSRDPENKDECYFALVKGNLTKKRSGMKYKMSEKTIDGITAPYIEWLGETDEDANEVMAMEKESRSQSKKQVDMARMFLPQALEKGARLARELFEEAAANGISVDQLKRAKYELNIQSVKRPDGWYWFAKQKEQTFDYEDLKGQL